MILHKRRVKREQMTLFKISMFKREKETNDYKAIYSLTLTRIYTKLANFWKIAHEDEIARDNLAREQPLLWE